MEDAFNKLDLSGKLIIKASLGDDIRRIPIHNDDLTYDELVLMMQRVFKGKINPEEDLLLKYKDEEGDLITITDNSDLSFAIQYCRVLKLTILSRSSEEVVNFNDKSLARLRNIRDAITKLLDDVSDSAHIKVDNDTVEEQVTSSAIKDVPIAFKNESREFDPLNEEAQSNHNQVAKTDVDQQSISSHSSHQEATEPTQNAAYPPQQPPPASAPAPAGASAPAPVSQVQQQQPSFPSTTSTAAGYPQNNYPGYPGMQPPVSQYQAQSQPAAPAQYTGHQPEQSYAKPTPSTQRPAYPPQGGGLPQQQGYPGQQFQQPTSVAQPAAAAPGQPQSAAYPDYRPPQSAYQTPGSFPGYPGYPAGAAPNNPYSRGAPTQGYSHPAQNQQGYK